MELMVALSRTSLLSWVFKGYAVKILVHGGQGATEVPVASSEALGAGWILAAALLCSSFLWLFPATPSLPVMPSQ